MHNYVKRFKNVFEIKNLEKNEILSENQNNQKFWSKHSRYNAECLYEKTDQKIQYWRCYQNIVFIVIK